ncbi:hypothetical protein BSPWISOXPB_1005 [uncultured Gammaproteobacteria bacterium]|nr:hypothetical protein BSPWISOXPB_1005 [uncultured Gammaproteobacteria bacterium]
MVELGYTQAVDIKLVADSQDNRKGHYGEDNSIYLNDANLNNTKDLATTLGHETSHAIDSQDSSINTNPQNNTSKADNEIYAQNYGDDFSDYVEFASENYGDGNLADSNNKNLGNTPAERQRNQKLINNNNQDYAEIDKSKGEDSAIIRYATPVLKDPSLIIKIAENGLKAIGIIAGAEIVNQVSDSAQDDDTSDIPKIDDVSEVAGTGAPMPDGEPPEDWKPDEKSKKIYDKLPKKIKGKNGKIDLNKFTQRHRGGLTKILKLAISCPLKELGIQGQELMAKMEHGNYWTKKAIELEV